MPRQTTSYPDETMPPREEPRTYPTPVTCDLCGKDILDSEERDWVSATAHKHCADYANAMFASDLLLQGGFR